MGGKCLRFIACLGTSVSHFLHIIIALHRENTIEIFLISQYFI
jgi:hypothetical protein